MRGDVPSFHSWKSSGSQFSPHARGCSGLIQPLYRATCVFPACAGMFRPTWWAGPCSSAFSPHARGCSQKGSAMETQNHVFPACAGMFLTRSRKAATCLRFPRMRGDVPRRCTRKGNLSPFSPHARGCSCSINDTGLGVGVFPACAGMFRCCCSALRGDVSFPRMRGDVPARTEWAPLGHMFSPHARGCSGVWLPRRPCKPVFPACAGMFRCLPQTVLGS